VKENCEDIIRGAKTCEEEGAAGSLECKWISEVETDVEKCQRIKSKCEEISTSIYLRDVKQQE
jgi:hypothetical protein